MSEKWGVWEEGSNSCHTPRHELEEPHARARALITWRWRTQPSV